MKYKIYLAGPITGLTFGGATEWREEVMRRVTMEVLPFDCFSPLRGKAYLKQERGAIKDVERLDSLLSSSAKILFRDSHDVRTADAMLVNLLGADKVSIGTVMEIAWAYEHRVPTILMMEAGNIHDHRMIVAACPYIAPNVDTAMFMLKQILLPTSHHELHVEE